MLADSTVPDDARPLAGGWRLWRDFAVRSAGFPASGLDVFGPGDESERLRTVSRDPRFREAVTWQNPAALANAVDKIVAPAASKPSRTRRREEIVASYWQRYCAKNDTIGFFGPLAWGRVVDEGPPLGMRPGGVECERAVHLEAWGIEALAQSVDPALHIGAGPYAERDLRAALDAHPDAGVRDRGLAGLGELEAARDALAAAPPDALAAALGELDATFVRVTGREPTRNHGRAYGARTLAYVDCMRDVDVTVGPGLVADLAPALQALLEACRWYCGQVQDICTAVLEDALPAGGRGSLGAVLGRVMPALMRLPPELEANAAEFERRFSAVVADPDPATIGARAATAFANPRPGWPSAFMHSVDLQIAARDTAAIARGDYLAVIGDVHPGSNPLLQGVFAHRHPDPAALLAQFTAGFERTPVWILPPWAPGLGADARGVPLTDESAVHIAPLPETRAQLPRRTWRVDELLVDGADLVDAAGTLRVPLVDAFGLVFFVAGIRTFELLAPQAHAPRVTVGKTVLRRESWNVCADQIPQRAADVAAFARDLGMPRRVFAKSPLERKPMYLDVESPVLGRILCRLAKQAAAGAPGARMAFTEMLPAPDECWLTDADGDRYVAELRLVAQSS